MLQPKGKLFSFLCTGALLSAIGLHAQKPEPVPEGSSVPSVV